MHVHALCGPVSGTESVSGRCSCCHVLLNTFDWKSALWPGSKLRAASTYRVLLMKQQFVATHTAPALLDSWVTNAPLVSTQKKGISPYIFVKNTTCLNVGLLRICQVFSVSYKTVCRCVMAACCFMSDMTFTMNVTCCSDVATFFWLPGLEITMAAPNT